MLIVLDTNVLVSGLLNPHGQPGRIVDLLLSGRLRLAFDDRVLSEYAEVLARPRLGIRSDLARDVLAYLSYSGESVVAGPMSPDLENRLPDPDDAAFLEVALTSGAAALVTGNIAHFADAAARCGLTLLTPREFLTWWAAQG